MKREDLIVPLGRLTRGTRRQTFSVLSAIAQSHSPTDTMLAQMESAYRGTGQFLTESVEFGDTLEEIHPQGSRAIGTTIRPTAHVEFDIDLVARIREEGMQRYSGPGGQKKLLDQLHTVLSEYGHIHKLPVKRRTRCVSLMYSNDMHADITPVINSPMYGPMHGDTHGLVPDRDLQRFMGTNPLGYRRWFDGIAKLHPVFSSQFTKDAMESMAADVVPLPPAQEVFDRFLCRMVQVTKIHRNQWFLERTECAPTSIFLTTLIAVRYQQLSQIPHEDELDLFMAVITSLPAALAVKYVNGVEEWWLLNPTTRAENVACRMNTPERQTGFKAWLSSFVQDLRSLSEGFETGRGNDQTLSLLQRSYGQRSADRVRSDMLASAQSRRLVNSVVILGAASVPSIARSRSHTFDGDM